MEVGCMMVPAPGYSMARFWHIRVFSDFIFSFFKNFCTNDIHTHHLCALSCLCVFFVTFVVIFIN